MSDRFIDSRGLGEYRDLKPFRYWCQKVLPLVYDDSLSYYELLCKVVDYLNKTMEDVTTLHDDVVELDNSFKALVDFVNKYFDELDVQVEINNKLDAMAEDGTLYALIERFVKPVTDAQDRRIEIFENEQRQKQDVLEGRMDTFASLTQGSTTGDAELIDIRVKADGSTATTAGNAVREQVSSLSESIIEISSLHLPLTLVRNSYVKNDGTFADYNGWSRTNYIDCSKTDKIVITNESNATEFSAYNVIYNVDKTKVATFIVNPNTVTEVNLPAWADSFVLSGIDILMNGTSYKMPFLQTKEILSKVGENEKNINITENGKYVDSYGSIQLSENFSYSTNISIRKGDTIIVSAVGYLQNVSMIARVIKNRFIPLVISDGDAQKDYKYTALCDMDVVLSFDNRKPIRLYVDNGYIENIPYSNIFNKVGIIGDSLSSGELVTYYDGKWNYDDIYEHSWLSTFAKLNGCEKAHYSKGGYTCLAWLNSDVDGLPRYIFDNDSPCDAYFLALGTNDEYARPYNLGNINDEIGSNSFVGKYKEIINIIHNKAPKAVIFVVSLYDVGEEKEKYSKMINAISQLYDYCFFVNVYELSPILTTEDSQFCIGGHYNSQGYVAIGAHISECVNQIVKNNDYFKDFTLKYK